MHHHILKKIGYGVSSICLLHYGTVYVKQNERISQHKCDQDSPYFATQHIAHCQTRKVYQQTSSRYQLLDVHIFFRHGARTPIKHLPGLEEVCIIKFWDVLKIQRLCGNKNILLITVVWISLNNWQENIEGFCQY